MRGGSTNPFTSCVKVSNVLGSVCKYQHRLGNDTTGVKLLQGVVQCCLDLVEGLQLL